MRRRFRVALPRFVRFLVGFIGTWFCVGKIPFAAGTFGSIAALPFAWFMQSHYGSLFLFWASFVLLGVGWLCCSLYIPEASSEDPREMVIDEVAGQWLLLSFFPLTWKAYLGALLLFRFFDIVKPWPICVADRRIHGGFGVMFDDTLAALYPLLILYLLRGIPQAAALLQACCAAYLPL